MTKTDLLSKIDENPTTTENSTQNIPSTRMLQTRIKIQPSKNYQELLAEFGSDDYNIEGGRDECDKNKKVYYRSTTVSPICAIGSTITDV